MRTPDRKICRNVARTTILTFSVGILIGFGVGYSFKKTITFSSYAIRDNATEYKFIKPLLAVGNTSTAPTQQYQSLYNQVQDYIKNNSAIGDDTSVYFIDYDKGGRFAINEKDLYSPASLMKVVVMIAYFKKAESDPNILNQKLIFQPEMQAAVDSVQFGTPTTLKVGQSYSASDLIDSMIKDSDNGAMNVLIDNIGYPYLGIVYSALGLTGPTPNATNYKISASDYSLFFRILYNATYLTPEMSEKALSILSTATFDQGITSPLPKGTIVAHKFGEHVYGSASSDATEAVELHDCGLVYANSNPYFLCIMTHGSSLDALENRIQGISSLIYQAVGNNKSKN